MVKKFVGKLYNLFKDREFSEIKVFNLVILSISLFIKKKVIEFLSKIIEVIKNKKIKIKDIIVNFIDKLNISLEAKDVT